MSDLKNIEILIQKLRNDVRRTVLLATPPVSDSYAIARAREGDTTQELLEAIAALVPEEAPQGIGWCSVADLKVGDTYTSFPGSTTFEYTVLDEALTSRTGKTYRIRASRDDLGELVLGYFQDERVYRTSCAS